MREITGKNVTVAKELATLPNVGVVELKVTSDKSVETATGQILAKSEPVNMLINNTGIAGFGFIEALSLEQIR
jgi:NADP-dependent 3-hydroxy acid dehydrogenase YdfG